MSSDQLNSFEDPSRLDDNEVMVDVAEPMEVLGQRPLLPVRCVVAVIFNVHFQAFWNCWLSDMQCVEWQCGGAEGDDVGAGADAVRQAVACLRGS